MYSVPPKQGESWWLSRLRRHLSELGRLAWPTIISRMGILTIVLADIMMVGQYGTDDLAYFAIGSAPVITVIVGGVGILMGTLVVTSNNFGAEKFEECGAVWRRSMPYAFLVSIVALLICLQGEALLKLFGQSDEMARQGGRVLEILGYGVPFIFLYQASNFFLEGIKRPGPGMVAMVLANLVNLALNWLLITGNWGAPEMGAEGAAWATTACRLFLVVFLTAYVWWMRDRDRFGLRRAASPSLWESWKAGATVRRIGYATGLANGVESAAFVAMSMFAGWIGAEAVAAYTVSFNLNAVFFMFALGLGGATSVRVGIAYGRQDWPDLQLAGWTGVGASTVFMLLFGGMLIAKPEVFASFYSDDAALLATAVELIAIVGLVLVMDGNQAVTAQALRGCRDVWVPTGIQTLCFTGLMIPLGYHLAFTEGLGVHGLVWSIFVATSISFLLLASRFAWIGRRYGAQVPVKPEEII